MTDTLDSLDSAEPHAVWGLLHVAAFLLGLAAGWRYMPDAVMEIPFVRAVTLLMPAALAVFAANLVRGLWLMYRGPQSTAEQFEVTALELLLVIVAVAFLPPLARVYNRVQTFREQ